MQIRLSQVHYCILSRKEKLVSEIYDTAQVAEKLKLNPVTVVRLVKSGKLQGTFVYSDSRGRGIRVTEEALEEFMRKKGTDERIINNKRST